MEEKEKVYRALEEAAKEVQIEKRKKINAYRMQESIYEKKGISGHEVSKLLEKDGLKIPNPYEEHQMFLGIIEEKYKDDKPFQESIKAKLARSDSPSDSAEGTLIGPTEISLQGSYALGMDELLKECGKIQQAIEKRIGDISQGKEEAIEKTIKMVSELEDKLDELDKDLESQTKYFFKDKSKNYNIAIVEDKSKPYREFLSEISKNESIINYAKQKPKAEVDQGISRQDVIKRAEAIGRTAFKPQPQKRNRANAMSNNERNTQNPAKRSRSGAMSSRTNPS